MDVILQEIMIAVVMSSAKRSVGPILAMAASHVRVKLPDGLQNLLYHPDEGI